MIFQVKGHIEQIMAGTKTQTRRLVKPGQRGVAAWNGPITAEFFAHLEDDSPTPDMVVNADGRLIYAVGNDYAVQAGRGKPEVARIRILSIQRDDVRNIGLFDAQAEGGYLVEEYLHLWESMYDQRRTRTNELYNAWALTFEVVK